MDVRATGSTGTDVTMSKKTHVGQHGKPRCISVWSAHVKHKPSIVLPLAEFQQLTKERQCQRCAKLVDMTVANGPTASLGMPAGEKGPEHD